jgi:hypothetical protein
LPCYHLSRAHMSAEIDKLEARGERVVAVVPDGAIILVFTDTPVRYVTRPAAPELEQRGA